MSGFVVNVAELQHAAALTATLDDELGAALERLQADVDEVLSSGWRGGAAAAFAGVWHQWDAAACSVVAELSRLAEELARTGCAYALRDVVSADELRSAS